MVLFKARSHEAYVRRSKSGKLEQIPAKGVVKPNVPVKAWLDVHEDEARRVAAERGLKVPPAWVSVQINSDPGGHLQVRGRDAAGVLQRLYSIQHEHKAAADKFSRCKALAKAWPKIMKRAVDDFPKREEARVLYLIAKTGMRVGGDDERGAVAAYGASTLKPEHVQVKGDTITFDFTGKKGVNIVHALKDKRLAPLFKVSTKKKQFFSVTDHEVRGYLQEIGAGSFLIKDFRTHVANETALAALAKIPAPKDDKERKQAVKSVCEAVAHQLGNTWQVARDAYISPEIFDIWKR